MKNLLQLTFILTLTYSCNSTGKSSNSSKSQSTVSETDKSTNDTARYSYIIKPHKDGTFGFGIVSKFHDKTGQKKDFFVPEGGAWFIPRGGTEQGFKTKEEAEKMAKYYVLCMNNGYRDPEFLLTQHVIDSLGLTSSYSQGAYRFLPKQ